MADGVEARIGLLEDEREILRSLMPSPSGR